MKCMIIQIIYTCRYYLNGRRRCNGRVRNISINAVHFCNKYNKYNDIYKIKRDKQVIKPLQVLNKRNIFKSSNKNGDYER